MRRTNLTYLNRFQVGITDVIRGWSLGVIGMCIGEIRKLTIPAHLAYGEKGAEPVIPGNNRSSIKQQNSFVSGGSVLVYDVLLKSVEDGFKDIMIDIPLSGEDLDQGGFAGALMKYLRTHLTKHRRGSFINNGVRYKT